MRVVLSLAAAMVAVAAAMPVIAQQADTSVNSYLCQFAGKCGGAADVTPTKAAPATKGFRLAAPQTATPTQAAPATKGFRLAAPQAQPSPGPSTAAPPTKGFRLAHPATAPAPAKVQSARRPQMAAARPAPMAGTRANLMLNFEYNSDQMTPAAQGKAQVFAQALTSPELKDKRFLIEGHTDSRGSRDLNVDLSRRRAQSVADFLIAHGVEASRVEVKGVGPDEPLPGHAASAEANRRVEAVLLS